MSAFIVVASPKVGQLLVIQSALHEGEIKESSWMKRKGHTWVRNNNVFVSRACGNPPTLCWLLINNNIHNNHR